MEHRHVVKFFANEHDIFDTVAGFLGEGLAAGQAGLVIATASRRIGILQNLGARMMHLDRELPFGDLVLLDAEETLSRFMNGTRPDPERFRRTLGAVIEQMSRRRVHTPVRAYGEMVDLLWQQGRVDATIEVEHLWNELAATHDFSLLCGYSVRNISEDIAHLQRVCCLHGSVIAPSQPAPAAKARSAKVANPLGSVS